MSRTRRLLAIAAFAAVCAFGATPAEADSCGAVGLASGTCSFGGGTNGDSVDLWGDAQSDGSSSSSGGSGGTTPTECPVVVDGRCEGSSGPKEVVTGPISVHDLASFRPHRPTQSSEPVGWTIRAIPTNFLSVSGTHVVAGTLLDNPAHVRFTPVRYERDFGDGVVESTSTPGSTWRALGQPEWTRTETSHEYATTGQFTVDLVVWFSAEFRFGNQGWTELDGLVRSRATPLEIVVLPADTVLVQRQCRAGAVGCGIGA